MGNERGRHVGEGGFGNACHSLTVTQVEVIMSNDWYCYCVECHTDSSNWYGGQTAEHSVLVDLQFFYLCNETKHQQHEMERKRGTCVAKQGGVFPGNGRKRPDCARKQRNGTTRGTTHTSVLWSHGHGTHCHWVHTLHPYWADSLSIRLIHLLIGRFTHSFTDLVSECYIEKLIQSTDDWPNDCFSLWLSGSSLTKKLSVSLVLHPSDNW